MRRDNRISVELSKVQWARFGYRNQYGDWRNTLIGITNTYRNNKIGLDFVIFNPCKGPEKSCLEWLIKNNMLDIWKPELYLKLTANESLVYTGEKAKSIWKTWNERIYGKK